MTPEISEQRTILKILAGSHIHGLNVPESDRDEEAIVIEPLGEMVTLGQSWEDMERIGKMELCQDAHVSDLHRVEDCRACHKLPDLKYFSLRKWCRMAAHGNPNFLLMLFAPQSSIIKADARGYQLRELAPAFISKQAIRSHLGYMKGQRQRMLNQISCHEDVGRHGGHGRPRHDLCEKFGYDTKFAMHLLRLGMQGYELAAHGRITLPMPEADRTCLMAVRRGEVALDAVLKQSEGLEEAMKIAFDSSSLPDHPDYAAIEDWMQMTYIRTWGADRRSLDMLEDAARFAGGHH